MIVIKENDDNTSNSKENNNCENIRTVFLFLFYGVILQRVNDWHFLIKHVVYVLQNFTIKLSSWMFQLPL